jgi:hypothetical protein
MIYYMLYLVAPASTISMVLVHDDDDDTKHLVYYLSKGLIRPKIRYSHVEKLNLAAVIVVQIFLHYILLRKTIIIFYSNPMYHILTRQVLGEK